MLGGRCGAQIPGTICTCHSLQVYMKISVPKGVRFVGHPGRCHLTKKMCMIPGEAEPNWVVLSFSDLGISNITGEGPMHLWASFPRRLPRSPGADPGG